MVIWAYVDKETKYLMGWSHTKDVPELVEIDTSQYEFDIERQFFACKYDYETETVIFDEDKLLEIVREDKEYDLRSLAKAKLEEGFPVNINNKNLTFKPTDRNKSFLEQAYSLFTNKIIGETTLPFINDLGDEVFEKVIDSNIFEVWLLAYVHEEDTNKYFNDVIMPKLKQANTVEEINKIEW